MPELIAARRLICYDRRAMFEFIAEHWILFTIAAVAGVNTSLLLGRLNAARLTRLAEQWRIEELERIEEINKQLGGRDG